jgi:hypothetical protein
VTGRADQPDIRCVFITGSFRSGTSALGWALAQHPRFWTSSEADFIHGLYGDGRLADAYAHSHDAAGRTWLRVNSMSYEEFCSHIGNGIHSLMASRAGARVWVDTTPSNTLMAHDLALMFPQARFIHIIRDGREVVESMLASGFDVPAARDFATACNDWRGLVNCGIELEQSHADRVLRVWHSRMSADPASFMDEVLSFLGAEASDAPAEFLRSNLINSSFSKGPSQAADGPARPQQSARARVERWDAAKRKVYERIAGSLHRQLFGA